MKHDGVRGEGARRRETRTDTGHVVRTTASDLKSVAEDMLRMGRHWASAAQDWLERAGDGAYRDGARWQSWSRSDRDLQSDFGGDGYDQVVAGYAGAGANDTEREYAGRDFGGRDYRGVGPRNYSRSDERILEDLNERLTEAHDLDASGITVAVSEGVATLEGQVPQRWMKHRAEDLVDACTGVTDVRNHIVVATAGATAASASGASGATGKEAP